MSTEQTARPERKTISVWLGTMEQPLLTTKASTDVGGMKFGKGAGSIFLEVQLTQSQVTAFETNPAVAAIIAQCMTEVNNINTQIDSQLATPGLPEAAKMKLNSERGSYTDWKHPVYVNAEAGDYTPVVDESGEALFLAKFTQRSITKQLTAVPPVSVEDLIRVSHIVPDPVTGTVTAVMKDGAGNIIPKVTKSGGNILIRFNTLMSKHPSLNQWGLATSRLVTIMHLTEGENSSATIQASGYDPLAGTNLTEHIETAIPTVAPAVAASVTNPYVTPVVAAPVAPVANPYVTPVVAAPVAPVVAAPVAPVVAAPVAPVVAAPVAPAANPYT